MFEWLEAALESAKERFGFSEVGASERKCPKPKTALVIFVRNAVTMEPVAQVQVDLSKGPTPGSKPTEQDTGLAPFNPAEPGDYDVKVTLPAQLKTKFEEVPLHSVTVTKGQLSYETLEIFPMAPLKVRVVRVKTERDADGTPLLGVSIDVAGGAAKTAETKGGGWADFGTVRWGDYTATVRLSGEDANTHEVVDNPPIKVPPGESTIKVTPCWVKFEIRDDFDALVSDLPYVITFPDGKKKQGKLQQGIAQVEPGKGPFGEYTLALKIISDAKWQYTPLKVGTPVSLTASASGFDDGTTGSFEIFDACGLSKAPVETVEGKVTAEKLEGTWTPMEAKLKDVGGGTLVFVAKVGDSQSVSLPVPVVVEQPVEILDEQGPSKAKVVLHFTGGSSQEVKDAKVDLPLGEQVSWIEIPEQAGSRLTVTTNGEAHDTVVPGA